MEQTKGYVTLKGKIWGLDNKKPYENDYIKSISFGLQTKKDNSIFVQLGQWKNTTLNVKLKGQGMEEILEINECEAVDKFKEMFSDGDSVFINVRAEVNPLKKTINYLVNQVYIENQAINFDADNFEETNFFNTGVIVVEKPVDNKILVGLTNYQGKMIEQELQLNDEEINEYMVENADVGDMIRLSISINRKPNYVDNEEVTSTRKTLKGKVIETGGRRNIDGYTEFLEVIDVDVEKTEKKKYTRPEIRAAIDEAEVSATPATAPVPNDDDLPF